MYQAMTWDYTAHPARFCGPAPSQKGVDWDAGGRLAVEGTAAAQHFTLDRYDPSSPNQSPLLPYFFGRRNPLMTVGFYSALQACGVDNLEAFPADVRDSSARTPVAGAWVAVNVVGLIAAADLDQSISSVEPGLGTMSFERLVIDAKRTRGARMFRLAEDPTHVWVDEPLRLQLRAAGFTQLRFWRPTQVASL